MITKIKIYSDRSIVKANQNHVIMLHPFWGKNPEDPRDSKIGRYDKYIETGQSFFELTSLENADFAVFPLPWQDVIKSPDEIDLAKEFTEKAKRLNKQVIIFLLADSVKPIILENTLVFRTSAYASQRKPNEFAIPAWSEDFIDKYLGGNLPIRHKLEKPVIGFCGQSKPLKSSLTDKLKELLLKLQRLIGIEYGNIGSVIRSQALNLLSQSSLVQTNFILRDGFFGGSQKKDGSLNFDLMEKVRQEYLENMIGSDYIFCCRGMGNYSYRFYETLSCGRIPVFINTDCMLPYQFMIDYKKYCVWIEEKDIAHIAEKVAEFHSRLSPDEFIDLQHQCRIIWEKYLSPTGFFANFHHHFDSGKI